VIYVALLRGIGPTNPNMHPLKLKSFFESLGFSNVHTVIASGNVIFETRAKNTATLEAKIEKALPQKLGFASVTIIRNKAELEKLIKKNPYKGVEDKKPNYLLVTFFKDRKPELCSVLDITNLRTPDFMRGLEKKHGKAITSRTWKTVHRILARMN
jgi:uncharacterized protein (DUF1697 family)